MTYKEMDSAIINETEGWVTGVDSDIINTAMTGYRAQVEEYFTSQHPDATVGDVLGTKTIIAENHPILIGTLPYKMREIGTRMSTIPDEMRHKVRFTVRPDEMNYDAAHIEHSIGLPELAGKKVTLSYSPATAEDEAIINSYLPAPHPDGTPIDPSEFPDELPAYLINMNSELRVEGEVVATGGPYQLGTKQTFHMHFDGPALSPEVVNNCIYAGEYYGIAIDVARISKGMMEKVKARLENTKAKLEAEDYEGLTKDDLLGDLLYTTAMTYYAEYDVMDEIQASTIGVNNIRVPSQSIFKTTVDTYEMFGAPMSVSAGGLMMDVDRNLTLTKAKDGDRDKYLQFMQTSGMNSSVLEHSVPERLLSTPGDPAYGVSAAKAIQIAASQGIPIYTINRQNVDTVISKLQLDDATIQEIRNAVNAGNEVTTSKTNINFHGWQGCGYIVYNPKTGTGGYMITGQENGVRLVLRIINAIFSIGVTEAEASTTDDNFEDSWRRVGNSGVPSKMDAVLYVLAVLGSIYFVLIASQIIVAGLMTLAAFMEAVMIACAVVIVVYALTWLIVAIITAIIHYFWEKSLPNQGDYQVSSKAQHGRIRYA